MKTHFKGSILLISLVMLSGILAIIFITKDRLIIQETVTQNLNLSYLNAKFKLVENIQKDKNTLCQQQKQEEIKIDTSGMIYQFFCKFNSIFIEEPNSKKYVQVTEISQLMDIEKYKNQIIHINSLSDLPESSLENPRIVIADNEIDERLLNNFYGIIITDYFFDITGKQFYGKLYSTFDNDRIERNLSYKSSVIENLKQQYGEWEYLPHSQNLLSSTEK